MKRKKKKQWCETEFKLCKLILDFSNGKQRGVLHKNRKLEEQKENM